MSINAKIYHIVHIDNLPSIVADGYLFSDAEMKKRLDYGVAIGMNKVKERRLGLPLTSHPGLCVGECVPFYFCPRSVMLYILHMRNSPDIEYRGGQAPIVHLVSDLQRTVKWAEQNRFRWAFTTSNAGAYYFDDYAKLSELNNIDWKAVQARQWSDRDVKEKKQAEFLVERCFPWELVEEIGVYAHNQYKQVSDIVELHKQGPVITIQNSWYY